MRIHVISAALVSLHLVRIGSASNTRSSDDCFSLIQARTSASGQVAPLHSEKSGNSSKRDRETPSVYRHSPLEKFLLVVNAHEYIKWSLLAAAVGCELAGGVLMKASIGFRNTKTLAALALVDVFLMASIYGLLFQNYLSDVWAWFTQLEYIGMTLIGLFVFEERTNKITLLALGLGMLGAWGFDLNGTKQVQLTLENATVFSAAVCSFALLVVCASYKVARSMTWVNLWTVTAAKYLALLAAVIFEVSSAIMMESNLPVAGLFCCFATSASSIVMLEFMDLTCGWAMFTGLEFILVECSAKYVFMEPLSKAEAWSAALILASVILLALGDTEGLASQDEHLLKNRVAHVMGKLVTFRKSGSRVAVLIGPCAVGKLVFSKLLSDFDNISCAVVIDKYAMPMVSSEKPVFHLPCEVLEGNMDAVFALGLQPGDIVVELGHRIATKDLVAWCHQRRVHVVIAQVSTWGNLDVTYLCTNR
mmetsp:Transcript_105754/g.188122  ORF Transcript_105754/g.188122 Transcript_105754/m.188122 type:complete len:477 (-) Transcript_105754:180-1610(-)